MIRKDNWEELKEVEGSILRMQALLKVYSDIARAGLTSLEVLPLRIKKALLIRKEALEESLELKSSLSRFLKKERI
ncbi:hypothetical protein COV21_01415 [Candidatus Woesearchaeota archaeon CG10_big_fil_rev_8_21_14_0_10_45_5]|nr:MAG: hypothetical protein COV21_01415 [Candidatus Woesearchaeota archaeon CG10_big_fil_rev_8_21_14_0_10_45_5]PIU30240.1 MAG: hypothetical protein COT07_01800 [Candidatus Woesearchaeota archaeon CG07_land_8_20_14_0_80_44_23]